VLGLLPETTHTINIHATSASGKTTNYVTPLTVTTEPLPEGFPSLAVITSQPDKMEPGYTLLEAIPEGRKNKEFGAVIIIVDSAGEVVWYIIIVDSAGEVVWYMTGTRFTDVRQLANGNLTFLVGNQARVINMLGNVVQEWHASRRKTKRKSKGTVTARAFHHELFPMENGNFLTLSAEQKNIANFPTSESDAMAQKENASVVGDLIIEFDPDGNIINSWSILSMLDPQRIGFGSLGSYWNIVFGKKKTNDWSHGNAVTHQPEDDSIIVTLRHQDATVKFHRKTGELIWILSPHENWDKNRFEQYLLTPTSDEKYFFPYHHHAHEVLPNGNLMLYDNGSYGASPFNPQPRRTDVFSRAVEYKINEKTKQAEIIWQYGQHADTIYYSGALGDADYLPQADNVLITHGSLASKEKINTAIILEVTHTTPAKEVFKMKLYDDAPEQEGGWRVYRAERIPDLYAQKNLMTEIEK
jgi:arylsulfate sulfotransferase